MAPQNAPSIVELVKSYFENYEITENDLIHPTSDFVQQFYWDYLIQVEEHFCSAAKCDLKPLSHVKQEKVIAVMIMQLNTILQNLHKADPKTPVLQMTIGDLYAPTAARTKKFVLILMHYLIFLGTKLCFKPRIAAFEQIPSVDEIDTLQRDCDEGIDRINNNAAHISELKDRKRALEDKLMKVNEKYKSVSDDKVEKDKITVGKRENIEKLQVHIENLKESVGVLEMKIRKQKEQLISEEEHEDMIKTLNQLNCDMQELDKMRSELENTLKCMKQDMASVESRLVQVQLLTFDKENYELFDMCKRELNSLDLQLKSKKSNLDSIIFTSNNRLVEKEELKKLIKSDLKEISVVKNELENFKIKQQKELSEKCEAKLKKINANEILIEQSKNDIIKIEGDKSKLLKSCAKKYKEYSQSENDTTTFYNDILTEIEETIREELL